MAFARFASLLRNVLHRKREERELDEEVRAHELLLADEKIRAGMNGREAQRQARLELGGVEQVKEQGRSSVVEQTLPMLALVSPNTLNWRHLTKTGSLANGK